MPTTKNPLLAAPAVRPKTKSIVNGRIQNEPNSVHARCIEGSMPRQIQYPRLASQLSMIKTFISYI